MLVLKETVSSTRNSIIPTESWGGTGLYVILERHSIGGGSDSQGGLPGSWAVPVLDLAAEDLGALKMHQAVYLWQYFCLC